MGSKSIATKTQNTPHRFLGLELSGAKNLKTTLAAIEYYPREKKIFVIDVYEKIFPTEDQNPDEALCELVQEVSLGLTHLAVNVPLSLPPCLDCKGKSCKPGSRCNQPSVKWMHDYWKKNQKAAAGAGIKPLAFTSYTQRPVEIWARYGLLPRLTPALRFEIDETLGGNKAPLTARMNYLQRAWKKLPLLEVWPKLSVILLCERLKLSRRTLSQYRQLENGVDARLEILEQISAEENVFIYERDLKKLSNSLTAFDSFICAYTGLLEHQGLTKKPPYGFPLDSGWIAIPEWEK